MKLHHIYLGTIMITTSFVAVAVEVHEQDEKKEAPEFSDNQSPDAKTVEDKLNVVDVDQIKFADLPPPPDVTKPAKIPD